MLFIGNSSQNMLAKAVALLMESSGYRKTDNEEEAECIIWAPPPEDLQKLALADLKIFRHLLLGPRKRILFVFQSQEKIPSFLKQKLDWFYPVSIGIAPSSLSGFFEWIEQKQTRTDSEILSYEPEQYRKLALSLFADNRITFSDIVEKASFEGDLQIIAKKLEVAVLRSDFFHSLQRMSRGYDQLEHKMNYRSIDIFFDKTSSQEYLKIQRQKCFLDFCFDLKRTLRVHRPQHEEKYILVIEDNPDKIHAKLQTLQELFFKKDKFVLLNPNNNPHKKLVNYLANYNSLSSSQNKELLETELEELFNSSNKRAFKQVMNNLRFALVDILLPDQPIGIAVIKGLLRFSQDFIKADDKPLDIIAMSRADDIEKIHAAMRAGACGYVLKSRLLAIPAIVGETGGARHEPANSLKRNFRSLYNLPSDTLRLLRRVTIPPIAVKSFDGTESDKYRHLAELLRKIPKTDLHVHVASCMSPEFLTSASLIMLARHGETEKWEILRNTLVKLIRFFNGDIWFRFQDELYVQDDKAKSILQFEASNRETIVLLAEKTKEFLKTQIDAYERNKKDVVVSGKYKTFRSVLHKKIGIPDHLNEDALRKKIKNALNVTIFQFAMISSGPRGKSFISDKDDFLRIFLIYLAARNNKATLIVCGHEWLQYFRPFPPQNNTQFNKIYNVFWENNELSCYKFRQRNWALPIDPKNRTEIKVDLCCPKQTGASDPLALCPDYQDNPIAWLLASGTRSRNLKSYLEGCEYAGAEHLRHPFLIHLYAQQTVQQFVEQGVLYAELRAAVIGYELRHNDEEYFTFQDACNCLKASFENAQIIVRNNSAHPAKDENKSLLWKQPFGTNRYHLEKEQETVKLLPTKVSIILTGKRHKPSQQLLREASSAIVLHNLPLSKIKTSKDFVDQDMLQCRIVGFDLAGQEDAYPPHLFTSEFAYLSKMHIPITVHAGENAPAEFVESAVLDLRARRLGHGLALADDRRLMNQVREAGVCVELCPVSNYQTNQFHESGRRYPLKEFLKNGNAVCLNTDNPNISYTNLIKECFQASFAYGDNRGLSLWELLRIFRMGFTHSFLNLPEKRAMLELVDQILFDLFSDPDEIDFLKSLDS